jgi:nicotinamidase-related amidase
VTSQAIRDPLADHLITPQNAALVLIDYQPSQFATVRSMDADLLRKNIISTVRAGIERVVQAGGVPIGWVSLECELQRDWNRQETVPQVVETVLNERLLVE